MDDQNIDLGSISILIPPSRSGEAKAREELFEELKGYLELIADQNLDAAARHKVGVSDIVQCAFIRVIENFEQFRGKTSGELKAWIKAIVRNEVNRVRRVYSTDKRDIKREVSLNRTAKGDSMPIGGPVDEEVTPSSRAVKGEQRQRVHEILSELKPDHAEVIRLRNIELHSFKEIGERMGRSEKSASQLWYRAMLNFEKKLRDSGEFAGE